MRISVFGGANPLPGDPGYDDAYRLGRLLGEAGHIVLTGGYVGTMEAVSRGAAESGAHVIGVTCDVIEAWRKVKPNPWVMEEMRFPDLIGRLSALITHCDAAVALPGGPGTLAEIALMWNQMLIDALPKRPLILVGGGWQQTLDTFFTTMPEYTHAHHRVLVKFAPDVESAAAMLNHRSD